MEPLSENALSRRRLLAAAALGSCVGAASAQSTGGGRVAEGAVVRIGQSAPVGGAAQRLGIELQRGIALAFQDANARGGVAGRKLELLSYDDAHEPEAALNNTRDLIESDKVFALMGYVGTEMTQRSWALAQKAGVPMVAPLTGADALRGPATRGLIHLRAPFSTEAMLITRNVATMGLQRVSVVVQADADGEACLAALQSAFNVEKIAPPVLARLARNSTNNVELRGQDVTLAVAKLLESRPQAIVLLTTYGSAAAVVREARLRGYKGGFYGTSLASASALAQALGKDGAGVAVTQVVPSPTDISRPVVAAYERALKRMPDAGPDVLSLEGWLSAQLLIEALNRCGANLTRERFVAALETLGRFDPGGFAMELGDGRRQASNYVALAVLDASGRARL